MGIRARVSGSEVESYRVQRGQEFPLRCGYRFARPPLIIRGVSFSVLAMGVAHEIWPPAHHSAGSGGYQNERSVMMRIEPLDPSQGS